MPPRWERLNLPPSFHGKLYMDAVLRPHRSLSGAAFRVMLAVLVVVNLVVAMVFWIGGAYPVAGFLGLDVLAIWLAFRANYRAGRAEQRVCVACDHVYVLATESNGSQAHWALNPIWARVESGSDGVRIFAGGGFIQLGAFLSPSERGSFAEALATALSQARKGG
ncbi:MAG: DUF2244 domain-containing protein [Terricaulis sp.]